jgi:hypothetical protein
MERNADLTALKFKYIGLGLEEINPIALSNYYLFALDKNNSRERQKPINAQNAEIH